MTPALSIASLTDRQLTRYVNDGFKQYHSVLLLSRSPLADSDLVTPTLVRDEVSPTADDRGNGLRLVLRWAVEQLAPGEITHPLGSFRPYDDETWVEPTWWRYNILRHRYIEPLHPDEFVDGGRFTETLMALTGLPSKDAYFDERNRAIGEVAQWLRRQFTHGDATATLRRIALESEYRPLASRPEAAHLLGIAAAFADVFPRTLLVQMARAEGLRAADEALDYLVGERYLLNGDDGESLWLSPVLRTYVYHRQDNERARIRHQRASAHFVAESDPIAAVYHLQRAQQEEQAAALILEAAPDLMAELATEELEEALEGFDKEHLAAATWTQLQILLSDLYLSTSRHEDALIACRQALTTAAEDLSRGRIYRRMGKIYEQRNQLHALNYYAQAVDYLPETEPEYVETLKDRAWIHFDRSDWLQAEQTLAQALLLAADQSPEIRARIHDALASVNREEERHDLALEHARQALVLREEAGNPFDIAKSLNNLGILYTAMGHHAEAAAAHREAITAFEQIGNSEHMAAALLNAGAACHFCGEIDDAIDYYERSLDLSLQSESLLTASRAHSNLAEALVEQGNVILARDHWRAGLSLSKDAALTDEVAYYETLAAQTPALAAGVAGADRAEERSRDRAATSQTNGFAGALLDPEQRQALSLAAETGRLTAADLMDATQVSKATATRKLAALVESGHLLRLGKGRGTYYAPATGEAALERVASESNDRLPSHVRQLLIEQRSRLSEEYAVAGIAACFDTAHPAFGGPPVIALRFRALPDLLTFFELEKQLAALTGLAIRLAPVEALPPSATDGPGEKLIWLWEDA